jgi:hypothetical protein
VGHAGADVGGVAGLVEEVGVDVEGRAGAGVAEDAADLLDVELQVDDQVAGEGVAQVVESQAAALTVESGDAGGAGERASLYVALAERRAVARPADPVATCSPRCRGTALAQDRCELRGERDLAHR